MRRLCKFIFLVLLLNFFPLGGMRGAILRDMHITMPLSTGMRAQGSANDPDYAIFGTWEDRQELDNIDIAEYNCLSFDVSNDLDAGVANINVVLEGDSKAGLGAHLVNMLPGETKHVVYEFAELNLHHINAIRIYSDLKGQNISHHDSLHYDITNIKFEHVDHPEKTSGWMPEDGRIVYSMSGYFCLGDKTAICSGNLSATDFRITDAESHEVVFRGNTRRDRSSLGEFMVMDFSGLTNPGRYILSCGDISTPPFFICRDVFRPSVEKVLNFIHCQRCGDSVEGIHGKCHTDVFAVHPDDSTRLFSYGGGWHDAGDLSQQTLQTGDVAFALLEAYEKMLPQDSVLAARLKEEALHGMRQVMRCRMGHGWHASSIGLLHWTDGKEGTEDDIFTVRKQNNAFDNFLYAAYEAYAYRLLGDDAYREAAIEDFDYARRKFDSDGMDVFRIEMEHTYNTSFCTFVAAALWSASMLYEMTGEEQYARLAREYADSLLACQETEGDFAGFFYRDKSHSVPVHFIHQSREQLPVQALVGMLRSGASGEMKGRCEKAVKLYGNYLKRMMTYTLPYGMIPSGVYREREYDDKEGFAHLHLWAPGNASELFDAQLRQGVKVGDGLTLRRFPIWFTIFNGNETILLSSGKAAALCGKYLGDERLLQIAREQMYWTVGKNPFCQSLIYGEGYRYPSMDSFSSGEMIGEMPVGIRSFGDTDEPYWPQTNNACYKEVWVTSAGKWLSLFSELE